MLATGFHSDRHTAAGLRGSAPRFLAEGLAAAFAAAALIVGWAQAFGAAGALGGPALVRDQSGYGWALLLAALVPAIFDELAFRGMLQGRAAQFVGRRGGVLLSALVFALAHGPTPALPVLVLLGLHLGSLRARSRSLLPCILEHFLFAALLVLLL